MRTIPVIADGAAESTNIAETKIQCSGNLDWFIVVIRAW